MASRGDVSANLCSILVPTTTLTESKIDVLVIVVALQFEPRTKPASQPQITCVQTTTGRTTWESSTQISLALPAIDRSAYQTRSRTVNGKRAKNLLLPLRADTR